MKLILIRLLVVFFFLFIFAWGVMVLWNTCLIPAVDGIHKIEYWQSFGLIVLFNTLFNSHAK